MNPKILTQILEIGDNEDNLRRLIDQLKSEVQQTELTDK
jgi:hypothetical protein